MCRFDAEDFDFVLESGVCGNPEGLIGFVPIGELGWDYESGFITGMKKLKSFLQALMKEMTGL